MICCPWLPLFHRGLNKTTQSCQKLQSFTELIVVDYCKQSLHYTISLIVSSIKTYQMLTTNGEYNGRYFTFIFSIIFYIFSQVIYINEDSKPNMNDFWSVVLTIIPWKIGVAPLF